MTKKKAEKIVADIDLNEVVKNYIRAEFKQNTHGTHFSKECECSDMLKERNDSLKKIAKGGIHTAISSIITAVSVTLLALLNNIGTALTLPLPILIGLDVIYLPASLSMIISNSLNYIGYDLIAKQLKLSSKQVKALVKTGTLQRIMNDEKITTLRNNFVKNRQTIRENEENIEFEQKLLHDKINSVIENETSDYETTKLIVTLTNQYKERAKKINKSNEEIRKENNKIIYENVDINTTSL